MPPETIYHFAYTSLLNSEVGPQSITDIIRVARVRNRELGLTGLLVFDGESFIQYLEGKRRHVLEVVASIRADSRHEEMLTVSEGMRFGTRCFPNWSMAYALTIDDKLISELVCRDHGSLGEELQRRIPELDLEP